MILTIPAIWLVRSLGLMPHYSLATEWIMHYPIKQNGRRKLASVSESKIVKIKDDSVPENTKKATNFGLKVFKDKWRSHVLQTSVFQFVYRDKYHEFDLSLNRQQLIFTTTICLITSIFVDWFTWQNEFLTEIEEVEKEELKFYLSARKQDRSYYNKATLTSIRTAIDRHFATSQTTSLSR